MCNFGWCRTGALGTVTPYNGSGGGPARYDRDRNQPQPARRREFPARGDRPEFPLGLVEVLKAVQDHAIEQAHLGQVRVDQQNAFEGGGRSTDVAAVNLGASETQVELNVVRVAQNIGIGDRQTAVKFQNIQRLAGGLPGLLGGGSLLADFLGIAGLRPNRRRKKQSDPNPSRNKSFDWHDLASPY